MKANELRIGNWVNFLSNPTKIEGITNRLRPDCGYYHFEGYKTPMKGIHVSPIELTEAWLLKCEFEFVNTPNQYGWYKTVGNRNLCWCHSDFVSLEHVTGIEGFNDTLFDFDCKYLHQLQNLYFCLTNEELTINK